MSSNIGNSDYEKLREERDLYVGLLGLNDREHPEPFLDEALGLIVRVLGARPGIPRGLRSERGADLVARGRVLGRTGRAHSDDRFARDHPGSPGAGRGHRLSVGDPRPAVPRPPERSGLADRGRPLRPDRAEHARSASSTCRDAAREGPSRRARWTGPARSRVTSGRSSRGSSSARGSGRTTTWRPCAPDSGIDEVVGVSASLAKVLREVELVAPLDVAVLVTGETGTGKTQLARVIHENGRRRGRRFVELNCSAIPGEPRSRASCSARCRERTPRRLGASKGRSRRPRAERSSSTRSPSCRSPRRRSSCSSCTRRNTIRSARPPRTRPTSGSSPRRTATSRRGSREKRFRSDLFYRLQVLSVRMPALSERRADIAPLARHLCARAQRSHGLPERDLSPGAIRAIEAAEWRGNVRELAHAIEAAAIRAAGEGAKAIEATHLFGPVAAALPSAELR